MSPVNREAAFVRIFPRFIFKRRRSLETKEDSADFGWKNRYCTLRKYPNRYFPWARERQSAFLNHATTETERGSSLNGIQVGQRRHKSSLVGHSSFLKIGYLRVGAAKPWEHLSLFLWQCHSKLVLTEDRSHCFHRDFYFEGSRASELARV